MCKFPCHYSAMSRPIRLKLDIHISGTAGPIALKFGMLLETVRTSALPQLGEAVNTHVHTPHPYISQEPWCDGTCVVGTQCDLSVTPPPCMSSDSRV